MLLKEETSEAIRVEVLECLKSFFASNEDFNLFFDLDFLHQSFGKFIRFTDNEKDMRHFLACIDTYFDPVAVAD